MTEQDIQILIQYLRKVVVPSSDHEDFLKAFERLQALSKHLRQAA
jgi:hypothetical protein